jgi:hypothetical protein
MADIFNFPDNYRIEVSGWGLDNIFFEEKTDLFWSPSGGKRALLHRALPEGAMIFVRLLTAESRTRSVPVPYQVQDVRPMDCNGQCEMRLMRLYPRSKEPYTTESPSHISEGPLSASVPSENSAQLEPEEILQ